MIVLCVSFFSKILGIFTIIERITIDINLVPHVLNVPHVLVVPHIPPVPYFVIVLCVSNVPIVPFVLIVPKDSALFNVLDIFIITERNEADVRVVPFVLIMPYVLVVAHVFLCSSLGLFW